MESICLIIAIFVMSI